ncbi:MAG TPA: ArsA family ATPase [Syntrophales bacterium]|jgi:arsenite-transporting ATPase|nr:ArsA family ATPase [Syntrophales bacterium]HOU76835.1 ArsA family ATPase [Syntrophales bacterium]HPC32329.1 ArsA family ATPase [Syntrophales bacterium]HQG34968.1 ArsA family ATPase [Syntrophales bacterium]HQI34793.1 ArsA family ATPase [Syntrophales bacterium]
MKILFFTGKGGVGKSTLAAAAAWQLSRKRRVLIVSLDPAHNLGDIFGVAIKGRRRRFTPSLHLDEVDLRKMARAYLERETQTLSDTYKYLATLNLDSYFSVLKYSPGIEEYALLTSIERTIREEAGFDYVIFDTPPTGLTLRFLALPQVTITWIDRLTAIRRQILEKRYTIQKIRRPLKEGETAREVLLSYREDDDDIMARLKALHDNYRRLTAVLQGGDCGVVLVFNPDLLSRRESERLIEGLNDLRLPLRLLIQNKVTAANREIAVAVGDSLQAAAGGAVPLQYVALDPGIAANNGSLYEIPEDLEANLGF